MTKLVNKALKIIVAVIRIVFITTFMDFAGKIRAGRAFLGLTQDQLALMADLSLQGMQKVERGETQPTARTQSKIVRAFESRGVVFTKDGIEHNEYPIFVIEGPTPEDAYLQVMEDMYEHIHTKKEKELLLMYADDRVSPPRVNASYRRMRASGIQMRQLVQEGNTYLLGPLSEYRYVPKAFFINRVTAIYGDKVIMETAVPTEFTVRIDPIDAAVQRNTFNMLWAMLKEPTKSTAHEKF